MAREIQRVCVFSAKLVPKEALFFPILVLPRVCLRD